MLKQRFWVQRKDGKTLFSVERARGVKARPAQQWEPPATPSMEETWLASQFVRRFYLPGWGSLLTTYISKSVAPHYRLLVDFRFGLAVPRQSISFAGKYSSHLPVDRQRSKQHFNCDVLNNTKQAFNEWILQLSKTENSSHAYDGLLYCAT